MPWPLAVNDVVSVNYYCRLNEQIGITSTFLRVTAAAAPGQTDANAAVAISAIVAPLFKAYLPAAASFRGLRLQIVHPVPRTHQVYIGDQGPGTIVGDPLPSQVAMVCRVFTDVASRNSRGRSYLPFWAEGDNDVLGNPNNAAITKAGTLNVQIHGLFTVGVAPAAVNLAGGVWSRELQTFFFTSGTEVRTRWGTQRRRSHINRGDPLAP